MEKAIVNAEDIFQPTDFSSHADGPAAAFLSIAAIKVAFMRADIAKAIAQLDGKI